MTNQMTRMEKIEKGLNKLGNNFTTADTLGAFSMGKKIELAEESSRLAYAVLSAVVDELKEIKANGK
ncbi:hypothetical protein [Marinomonas atlantica]|uniref:hypothetical protein n=1 Tax=Marinomonas atlantica TaxID=1806668 RepID=UPI00082B7DDF|nr:hypothetical protein [Marinomonas atlantica]